MEENNVVMNAVVENPVVNTTPEVVETVQTAIEPVQVPQITVPVNNNKTFLGLDSKTWTDIGVLSGSAAVGALLDRALPWAFKKVKSAIETAKDAYAVAKNNAAVNQNTAQQSTQEPAKENPVPQQPTEATPVTPQENK